MITSAGRFPAFISKALDRWKEKDGVLLAVSRRANLWKCICGIVRRSPLRRMPERTPISVYRPRRSQIEAWQQEFNESGPDTAFERGRALGPA
jgi:hypothetical protein